LLSAGARQIVIGVAITLSGLTKCYGAHVALDDVSLDIAQGSFVALVGSSGSGKTTLLKTINRLIEPDRGTIRIDGTDISDTPVAELRREIGYVFQGIGLFPHMSVAENIGIVPRLNGGGASTGIDELMRLTALPPALANRYPRQLSGGQAQRVGLARALAAQPKLMLMDEPFGALDPVTRDDLGRAYRALHEQMKLTTILVTHDMAEALLLADRVIVLGGGRILADATPRELANGHSDPAVAALIDVPRRQAERMAELARR